MSRTIMIIAGAVAALVVLVAIGIGVFLLMPTITNATGANSSTPTPTAATIESNSATPASNKTAVSYIRQYSTNIEQPLALGLKLTSDQLTTQLRSGKTLTQIATDQKVTGAQFNTIIATAVQNGLQPAITARGLTQKQVTALVKHFQKNPDQLGHLLIAQTRKKGTQGTQGTPTPQP